MAELPIASVKRIMKNAGADRISEDSAQALEQTLVNQATVISETAINFAKHAGRKTVTLADIELAVKTLYE